jgi:integrase
MAILGHSNISLTMNVYTTALPSVMADAADRMDEALGSGS